MPFGWVGVFAWVVCKQPRACVKWINGDASCGYLSCCSVHNCFLSPQSRQWDGAKSSLSTLRSIFIFTLHFRACRSNLLLFFPIYLSPLCTCCCFWWKSHKEVDVNVSFIITCVHSIPVKRLEVNGWVDTSVGVWIDGSVCRWKRGYNDRWAEGSVDGWMNWKIYMDCIRPIIESALDSWNERTTALNK